MKNLKGICAIVMLVAALCGCERGQEPKDAREAFVGYYTFVSTGKVDLYRDSVLFASLPMNKEGEMSIMPGEKSNEIVVIALKDTAVAYVSGNTFSMDTSTRTDSLYGIVMEMTVNYGKAVLTGNQLDWPMDLVVSATFQGMEYSGGGSMEIVATKKNK